jgi:hypothetical protein
MTMIPPGKVYSVRNMTNILDQIQQYMLDERALSHTRSTVVCKLLETMELVVCELTYQYKKWCRPQPHNDAQIKLLKKMQNELHEFTVQLDRSVLHEVVDRPCIFEWDYEVHLDLPHEYTYYPQEIKHTDELVES